MLKRSTTKKLALNRETVRALSEPAVRWVHGGAPGGSANCDSNGDCSVELIPGQPPPGGGSSAQLGGGGGGYDIKNLDHSKALLVNGEVFKTTRLQHGDWITIADTTFVFSEDSEPHHADIDVPSIDADELFRSQIQARRKQFEDADSMLESLDRSNSADQRLKTLFRLAHRLSASVGRWLVPVHRVAPSPFRVCGVL